MGNEPCPPVPRTSSLLRCRGGGPIAWRCEGEEGCQACEVPRCEALHSERGCSARGDRKRGTRGGLRAVVLRDRSPRQSCSGSRDRRKPAQSAEPRVQVLGFAALTGGCLERCAVRGSRRVHPGTRVTPKRSTPANPPKTAARVVSVVPSGLRQKGSTRALAGGETTETTHT